MRAIALFGFAVTLGLLVFEIFGIAKCARLIAVGRELEEKLRFPEATGSQERAARGAFRVFVVGLACIIGFDLYLRLRAWMLARQGGDPARAGPGSTGLAGSG